MTTSEMQPVDLDARRAQVVQEKLSTPVEPNEVQLQVRDANEMLRKRARRRRSGLPDRVSSANAISRTATRRSGSPVWEYARRLASGRPIAIAGHRVPAWRTDGDPAPSRNNKTGLLEARRSACIRDAPS